MLAYLKGIQCQGALNVSGDFLPEPLDSLRGLGVTLWRTHFVLLRSSLWLRLGTIKKHMLDLHLAAGREIHKSGLTEHCIVEI